MRAQSIRPHTHQYNCRALPQHARLRLFSISRPNPSFAPHAHLLPTVYALGSVSGGAHAVHCRRHMSCVTNQILCDEIIYVESVSIYVDICRIPFLTKGGQDYRTIPGGLQACPDELCSCNSRALAILAPGRSMGPRWGTQGCVSPGKNFLFAIFRGSKTAS